MPITGATIVCTHTLRESASIVLTSALAVHCKQESKPKTLKPRRTSEKRHDSESYTESQISIMKLDAVPHTTVTVVAAGETLVEYDDANDTRVSDIVGVRYIEASSGSEFKVVIAADREIFTKRDEQDGVCCEIYLDGMYVEAALLRPRAFTDGKVYALLVGKYDNTQNTLEKLRFVDLETSDESVAGVQNERLKHIGEIKIVLQWVLVSQEQVQGQRVEFKPAVSGKIPEKCLKGRAVSRMATLGEAESLRPPPRLRVDRRYGNGPFASFIFKYRSRRDLQIEGIIPRDPSPVPKSPGPLEDRDIDKLPLEEAREHLRRLIRGGEGAQINVKKEKRGIIRVDEDSEDDVAITEVSSRDKRRRISPTDKENLIEVSDDE